MITPMLLVWMVLPYASSRADFSCMVTLKAIDMWRYDPVSNSSECTQMVDRAASRCTSPSIKITSYTYYHWRTAPGTTADLRHIVTGWCYRQTEGGNCVTPTPHRMRQLQNDLFLCLRHAARKGFKRIYVVPMISPLGDSTPWRGASEFDPLAKQGGLSFKQVVTDPTVAAARRLMGLPGSTVQVHYGLSGEMNRPLVVYPKSWTLLVQQIRTFMAPYKMPVGPDFGTNKLCGSYCVDYTADTGLVTAQQWADFRTFMTTVDEFGVSLYTNVWVGYNTWTKQLDWTYAFRTLDSEMLESPGIGLTQLIKQYGLRMYLNEFAIGGCSLTHCPVRDGNVIELSAIPWPGVGVPYKRATDPWTPAWARNFRMEYYRQMLTQARTNGTKIYPWDAVFIWSQGSWDVGGIYPTSTTSESTWYDPKLMSMIKAYNRNGLVPSTRFYTLPSY